jgi:hypothetical protein
MKILRDKKRNILKDAQTFVDEEILINGKEYAKVIQSIKNPTDPYSQEVLKKNSEKILKLIERNTNKQYVVDKLIKDLKTQIETYQNNNTEIQKQIYTQKALNRIDAWSDFFGKIRTFGFSILGSILFVITIFGIGYIEKNVDGAYLPLAKYVQPISTKNPVNLKVNNLIEEEKKPEIESKVNSEDSTSKHQPSNPVKDENNASSS